MSKSAWDDDPTEAGAKTYKDALNEHAAARGRAIWNDKRRRGKTKQVSGQLAMFHGDGSTPDTYALGGKGRLSHDRILDEGQD